MEKTSRVAAGDGTSKEENRKRFWGEEDNIIYPSRTGRTGLCTSANSQSRVQILEIILFATVSDSRERHLLPRGKMENGRLTG